MIYGNSIGTEIDRTFIIEDADGNELVATVTSKEVVFDATSNDIRIGKVAATQNGVTVGEKEIPPYHTNEGFKLITNGSKIVLTMKNYDYTKLQAIICPFNTNLIESVGAEIVAINNSVYLVRSTDIQSVITKNDETTQIDFGISNDFGVPCLIRYFMYKEIY